MPCTTFHGRVALEGTSPENVLGRAILHCVELVEYLSGRRFEGLVETAEDGTRYLFVDPDIWKDLVDCLFKEIWDMCSELDFDQAECYPVTEDYAMDHDPLDLETVSSEGTFMMVEEQSVDCPDDTSEVASTLGTVKTDTSNITSRTAMSAKMRRGFQFIMDCKGTRNAKAALAVLSARPVDKAKENRLSLHDPPHGTSVSGGVFFLGPPRGDFQTGHQERGAN